MSARQSDYRGNEEADQGERGDPLGNESWRTIAVPPLDGQRFGPTFPVWRQGYMSRHCSHPQSFETRGYDIGCYRI